MANQVTDTLNSLAPNVSSSGIGTALILILLFLILIVGAGVIIFVVLKHKKFNIGIVVFQKVAGRTEFVGRYKGRMSKLGKTGDQILIIDKLKKVLPRPEISVSKNHYWFMIREDGEWINIGIQDIDEKFHEMNINFFNPDVRYQSTSISEGMLKARYDETTWLQKHWTILVSIAVIIILLVFMLLIANKQIEGQEIDAKSAETNLKVLEKLENILGYIDVQEEGGAGYIPATS